LAYQDRFTGKFKVKYLILFCYKTQTLLIDNDTDGIRNDMGAYGGPGGDW